MALPLSPRGFLQRFSSVLPGGSWALCGLFVSSEIDKTNSSPPRPPAASLSATSSPHPGVGDPITSAATQSRSAANTREKTFLLEAHPGGSAPCAARGGRCGGIPGGAQPGAQPAARGAAAPRRCPMLGAVTFGRRAARGAAVCLPRLRSAHQLSESRRKEEWRRLKRAHNKLELEPSDLSLTSPFIQPIIRDIFEEIREREERKSAYAPAATQTALSTAARGDGDGDGDGAGHGAAGFIEAWDPNEGRERPLSSRAQPSSASAPPSHPVPSPAPPIQVRVFAAAPRTAAPWPPPPAARGRAPAGGGAGRGALRSGPAEAAAPRGGVSRPPGAAAAG